VLLDEVIRNQPLLAGDDDVTEAYMAIGTRWKRNSSSNADHQNRFYFWKIVHELRRADGRYRITLVSESDGQPMNAAALRGYGPQDVLATSRCCVILVRIEHRSDSGILFG